MHAYLTFDGYNVCMIAPRLILWYQCDERAIDQMYSFRFHTFQYARALAWLMIGRGKPGVQLHAGGGYGRSGVMRMRQWASLSNIALLYVTHITERYAHVRRPDQDWLRHHLIY